MLAGDFDRPDRKGGPEPQPAEQRTFGDRHRRGEGAAQRVHVRLAQRALRARPELALQRSRLLLARPPADSRQERASAPEAHVAQAPGPTWRSWRPTAWSTRRSHSSSNPMPAARAASGSSDSSVRPGTVFTSRSQGVPAASTMMSTRPIPEQPRTVKARPAASEAAARAASGIRAGMMWCERPAVYLA